ncbi:MAG: RsmE family RNA methyltransferase [bacterium]|nr:RsmE family RNA methyltransferase [bacterium]
MLTLDDSNIVQQIRKVIRMKPGDVFFVQNQEDQYISRYKVSLDSFDAGYVCAKIIQQEKKDLSSLQDYKSFLIAMPNKRQKAEIIVQKLSEIGIQDIYFRPSERSIIKEKNENKRHRLEKISREATEQSR